LLVRGRVPKVAAAAAALDHTAPERPAPVIACSSMSEPKNLLKAAKHSVTFEVKLMAEAPSAVGTQRNPATTVHVVVYFLNGHQVAREDYLAALQMADSM
jgi:hypothetical protein